MIDGRVGRVVVTGGSSGIGLSVARSLVENGSEVCLVARQTEPLQAATEELGDAVWAHACDVSEPQQVAALCEAIAARWEAVDGLVNNAGIALMATLEDTEPEQWDQTFAINVRGPYLMCRALAPMLKQGRSPSVVNVSSTLSVKAIPGMAAYNASKAALDQLTRSLALEWAPTVRVNAVLPGVVDTPIHSSRGMSAEDVAGMGELHPMKRVGRPEDVAAMVVYLLSSNAAWMTGTIIPVDGGMLAG
jgi:NAD(P)-dependent dehydrogenase (short-subunit alcohol dehydrogenase family)